MSTRRNLALFFGLVLLLATACSGSEEKPSSTPTAGLNEASPTPAAPAATATVPPAPEPAPLAWSACGSFQCAKISVPLNYAQPSGTQIELAMMRLPARNAAQRIGSLLVNFGGPGGSGLDYLPGWQASVPGSIRDRFDLVTWDPRGVGQSMPLDCNDNIQELLGLDPTPETPEEWRFVEESNKEMADLCLQRHRNLLPHIGTTNVVRDLEQIRKALGEEKLTYLGYSYGTAIGAVYADLFPTSIRGLVLDGAVDPAFDAEKFSLEQALGFEGALDDYIAYCNARNCITSYPGDAEAAIKELLNRAEAAPIPAPGADRPAGPGEMYNALAGASYTELYWPLLTRALNAGLGGNATQLVDIADMQWQRNNDGSYPSLFEVLNAVNCVDYRFSRDTARYRSLVTQWSVPAPYFGAGLAQSGIICAYWGVEPTPLKPPKGTGAPPILVIGTTRDPATPYAWAVSLSEQLESAALLTYRGTGHTAYLRNSCINDLVNAYLLTLAMPAEGTACGDAALATPIDVTP